MSTSFVGIPTMTDSDTGEKKIWYLNGQLHREDGPAIECEDGHKEWYIHGKCNREDGPAIEGAYGYNAWYLNGKRHREDGPALETVGYKAWYIHGKLHREDGPAAEGEGKHWYLKGKRHREDGPAIECTRSLNGNKWYLNNEQISEKEHSLQTTLVKRAI